MCFQMSRIASQKIHFGNLIYIVSSKLRRNNKPKTTIFWQRFDVVIDVSLIVVVKGLCYKSTHFCQIAMSQFFHQPLFLHPKNSSDENKSTSTPIQVLKTTGFKKIFNKNGITKTLGIVQVWVQPTDWVVAKYSTIDTPGCKA